MQRELLNPLTMDRQTIDIAILGGGLAGGLIALALAEHRPELSVMLVEQGGSLGGNHVWSFFGSDIAEIDLPLLQPMIARSWDGYDVHFEHHSRQLATPYRSITSERFDAHVRSALPESGILTGACVTSAGQTGFTLADGTRFQAGGVIDARGAASLPHMAGGWQKFAGQMLRLDSPHGLARPIVMDARVEQIDGYRFVYCLPFSDREVFVEDTYYTDTPALDLPALRGRIAEYAALQGWQIRDVAREETGVLPVIAKGDFGALWHHGHQTGQLVAKAGARAALIHPLTSYSLPVALRAARHIAKLPDLSGAALAKASYDLARQHWQQGGYYRMLTRMLFSAAAPEKRHRILERFYRLPESLIERFYAGRSTRRDAIRILAGKPPVPVSAAIASVMGRGHPLASLDTGL